MSEKLTYWQMIVKLYRRAMENKEITEKALELVIGAELRTMVKEKAEVIASTAMGTAFGDDDGKYPLNVLTRDGNNYFLVFPDMETTIFMGMPYTFCKIEELLRLLYDTPEMKGIQLVIYYDEETKNVVTGDITKAMAAIALDM